MFEHRFEVDLGSVIRHLAGALYGSPEVFVRELLLQNPLDACAARALIEPGYQGRAHVTIEITPATGDRPPVVKVIDDGIGLGEQEFHDYLSVVGASSKRAPHADRQPFIGAFGIGFLSAFTVADEVIVRSRSARPGPQPSLEWRARADGRYTLETIAEELPVGTSVELHAKQDARALCDAERIASSVRHYGALLRGVSLVVTEGPATILTLGDDVPPWGNGALAPDERRAAFLDYGRRELGADFLDAVLLDSPEVGVKGVAFILSVATSAGGTRHRAFLKGMLVSDAVPAEDLTPNWAFFARVVLDGDAPLEPNLARDQLRRTPALARAREAIGNQLRQYLLDLARTREALAEHIALVHRHAMVQLAAEDDDACALLGPMVPFPSTSGGLQTVRDVARAGGGVVHYCVEGDAFERLRSVANAQHVVLLDASGSVADARMLARLAERGDGLRPRVVDERQMMARFGQCEPVAGALFASLLQQANADPLFREHRVRVGVRSFAPKEAPALYCPSGASDLFREAARIREAGHAKWAAALEDAGRGDAKESAWLYLNGDNELVRTLAALPDARSRGLALHVLFVLASAVGRSAPTLSEVALVHRALLELVSSKTAPNLSPKDLS